MSRKSNSTLILATSVILTNSSLINPVLIKAQVSEPTPLGPEMLAAFPYRSVMYVQSYLPNYIFRSSGTIAWYPNLLFMSAHVLCDSGRWATTVQFANGWNSTVPPNASQVINLRGYRVHTNYASNLRAYGMSHPRTYSSDFAVGFGPYGSNFATPVAVDFAGVEQLRSASTTKMLVGYPSRLDFSGRTGSFLKHATSPFTNALVSEFGSYMGLNNFATGGGFSGGPILTGKDGEWRISGIVVSGTRSSTGVYAMDTVARSTALEALVASGGSAPTEPTPQPAATPSPAATRPPAPTPSPLPTPQPAPLHVERSFVNASAAHIRDGHSRYLTRDIGVSRMPQFITDAKFTIVIDAGRRGDLDVCVRAPSGRLSWLAYSNSGDSSANLHLDQVDFNPTHYGTNPNGTWRIFIRDMHRNGRTATFRRAVLNITSR